LLPGIPHSFSKGWVALAALFPLLGIFQWWLQTDYMPRTDRPRVDMTAQLVEVNRSGPIVHLRAKVTLHNLGSTRVDSVGSLLRVTGYPPDGGSEQPSTVAVSSGIDWIGADGHDYRANPVDRADRTLLYSGVFFPTGGTFLPPGVSIATAPVIDVDSRVVGRVQLSATIAFVTARRLGSVHTCIPPRVDSADARFVKTSRRPFGSAGGGHYLCVESDLKPRNVVQSMVDDDPTIRSYIVLDDPAQTKTTEFPEFLFTFGTHVSFEGDAQRAQEVSDSIDANNPSEFLEVDDEYVLGDPSSGGG
jgi:hypothetical protein